ncbi:MAG: hypothetical protein J7L37_02200 [Thermococcus sp.]|nr:hypothetical protein [Thermococcus sp.]
MKRLLALILAIILLMPSLVLAQPSGEQLPPQNVFNFTLILQIQPAKVGNETTWIGKFRVIAKLVDPQYREYLDELAKNDSQSANALFWTIINNTVYTSLRYNVIQKYQAAGLHPGFVVPEGGPIAIGDDWNATVDLGVTDFLVLRDHHLVSPMAGNLTLWMANKTYAFNWNRFVLILPPGYVVHELSPKPAQLGENIAVWVNGSYLPKVSLESPGYSFVKFLNETEKTRTLKLRYTPEDGRLYFEAVFPASGVPEVVKDALLYTFKEALSPLSMDLIEEGGSIKVVGVALPPAKKSESLTSVTWEVYVTLPFPFSTVDVSGGSYKEAGPGVVILTVSEPNMKKLALYGGLGLLAPLLVLAVVLKRKRKGGGEQESRQEESSGEGEVEVAGESENEDSTPEGVE